MNRIKMIGHITTILVNMPTNADFGQAASKKISETLGDMSVKNGEKIIGMGKYNRYDQMEKYNMMARHHISIKCI